jgi:CRP-like cAMP-binding protein
LADKPTKGHATFELPASKQVIASRLNLTPETFSRILHSLSQAGLITVKGKRITVPDITRLSRFDHAPAAVRQKCPGTA